MLDATLIREQPEKIKGGIAAKQANPKLVDRFLEFDQKWREAAGKLDGLRGEQKKLSHSTSSGPPAASTIKAGKKNKEAIKVAEAEVAELERERKMVWMQIPNLPFDDVPHGMDESGNQVVRKWGKPPKFDFEPKDHVALGEALGIIDMKRAGEVSGARFSYLLGGAALMQHALVQYVLKTLRDEKTLTKIAHSVQKGYSAKPFVPVVPPVMIRPEVYERMDRLEPKEERYHIESDDLYLVGTAEHTLGPLHMDQALDEKDLPIRYIGFSTAFRREAGSYGKDTRGILRVHQFDKLEIESFTTAEHSSTEQDFIVALQEHFMQELKLPYQVVMVCTGDMGKPDARQIDIETWMPGQPSTDSASSPQAGSGSARGRYRETHTSDLMTDYQARRLNTKVKRANGEVELAHMNDATAFAIGRTLIAIIENYQTADGKVRVPDVLQEYVGQKVIQ